VDTSAWIAFFREPSRGRRIRQHLIKADLNITHTIVLAELHKNYIRTGRLGEAFHEDLDRIKSLSRIDCEILEDVALEAGKMQTNRRAANMSLVDCLLLALARRERGGKVLSCDSSFKNWKEALFVGGTK
jgi:predicted nucleic acid-binding protein